MINEQILLMLFQAGTQHRRAIVTKIQNPILSLGAPGCGEIPYQLLELQNSQNAPKQSKSRGNILQTLLQEYLQRSSLGDTKFVACPLCCQQALASTPNSNEGAFGREASSHTFFHYAG